MAIYELVANFPVGIFGLGLCGKPGLYLTWDAHAFDPGAELLLDVLEACGSTDNRLFDLGRFLLALSISAFNIFEIFFHLSSKLHQESRIDPGAVTGQQLREFPEGSVNLELVQAALYRSEL